MAQYRNRPLGVLDRVYGFLSGKTSISQVNLETPVTLVHDLSREAELGSGVGNHGGFLLFNYVQGVAAATTYKYSDAVYDSLAGSTLGHQVTNDLALWYMGQAGLWTPQDGSSDITRCNMALEFPVDSMEFVNAQPIYIPVWTCLNVQVDVTKADSTNIVYASLPTIQTERTKAPIYLPRTARFSYMLLSGAAIAAPGAIIWWIAWAGKRGTTPPGMR